MCKAIKTEPESVVFPPKSLEASVATVTILEMIVLLTIA